MASTTRKRPRTASIKPEAVSTAIAFLEGLPEKEKEDLSLREAIGQMQDTIKSALARGYTYDDVAKLLSEKGIKISALTLKNYAPSGKRQATKSTTKRGRKPAAKLAPSERTSTPAEPSKATKPKATSTQRSRQTKSAAKADTSSGTTVKATQGRKSPSSKAAPKTSTRKRKQSKL